MAAVLPRADTLYNAAWEPYLQQLAECLCAWCQDQRILGKSNLITMKRGEIARPEHTEFDAI